MHRTGEREIGRLADFYGEIASFLRNHDLVEETDWLNDSTPDPRQIPQGMLDLIDALEYQYGCTMVLEYLVEIDVSVREFPDYGDDTFYPYETALSRLISIVREVRKPLDPYDW